MASVGNIKENLSTKAVNKVIFFSIIRNQALLLKLIKTLKHLQLLIEKDSMKEIEKMWFKYTSRLKNTEN